MSNDETYNGIGIGRRVMRRMDGELGTVIKEAFTPDGDKYYGVRLDKDSYSEDLQGNETFWWGTEGAWEAFEEE